MAVDMFLVLKGVEGETADAVYSKEKAMDLLAWSWGMSQSGTTHQGTGSGSGKVHVQDISLTKYVDRASATLSLFCCNGKHIESGKLIVRKAGENPLDYLKVELNDIIVTNVSTGGSGSEDRLTEHVSINFGKFKMIYQQQNAKGGKEGGPVECAWDIAKNEKA